MSDDNPNVILTEVLSEAEAVVIVGTLNDSGVTATHLGALTSGMRTETMGTVKVLISQSDIEKATAILEQHNQDVKNIDWDNVDVGEME